MLLLVKFLNAHDGGREHRSRCYHDDGHDHVRLNFTTNDVLLHHAHAPDFIP